MLLRGIHYEGYMTNNKKHKLQEAVKEVRRRFHDCIAAEIQSNPPKSYAQIAKELGVSTQTVYLVAKLKGLSRNADDAEADGEMNESAAGGQ
jgi:DNA invertase Pin-like site-specific DNA recombinase